MNPQKRILTPLCNLSPVTSQVIVALIVTAVIHFKALVTHSSPESLYLIENVNIARLIHSSPLVTHFRVTSEMILQLVLYQNDMLCDGDEWVTSETK